MHTYAKAIAGTIVAALTSLQASLPDGIDADEGIAAIIAGIVALSVIWAVPNMKERSGNEL